MQHGSIDEWANSGWGEPAIGKQEQARDVSDEVAAGTNWCWQTAIRRAVIAWHQLSVTQVFSRWVNHALWKGFVYTSDWITECIIYRDGYQFYTSQIDVYRQHCVKKQIKVQTVWQIAGCCNPCRCSRMVSGIGCECYSQTTRIWYIKLY